jgi:tRNA(His) guanylyltransferase
VAFNGRYGGPKGGTFDARAYTVPIDDVPNVFVWRQQDWERNSVQMLARAHFSHKQCHKKNVPALHEMLHEIGVNWAHLHSRLKNGTYITREGGEMCEKFSYDEIEALIAVGGPRSDDDA